MLRLLLLSLTLAAAAGCAGYRLGPTNGDTAGARSVQVNFFQNKTLDARLAAPVNHALRKAIQQDGTFRLDTRDGGDLIITGSIIRLDRAGISFQPADTITVRDYALALTAHVMVTERSTGRIVMNRDVAGRTIIRVGADLSSAERQAVPLLAEDLARNATMLLVDGTW